MTAAVTPIITSAAAGPAFVRATFGGLSSPGAISVPGLQVGDVIIWLDVAGPPDSVVPSTQRFEAVVSVADELQQTTSGLNGTSQTIICLRGV